ncbi:glycosyltransferase [candidate division KSB1 bacterium]|nr:glycosyltransferase [candidate division KSB1 bacterium]
MKVLHLIGSPHLGGAEIVSINLVESLRERGIDARLLAFADGRPLEVARQRNLPVTLAELASKPHESRGRRWHRLGLALSAAVAEFRPDLVHSHVPLTNLICHRSLSPRGVPWVCTIHSSWRNFGYGPATVGRPWLRPYLMARHAAGDAWITRSAARIAANSHYVAKALQQIGVPAARMDVVHNGMNPPAEAGSRDEIRQSWQVEADAIVIGALGHLAPVKGFDILIRGFALLADRFPRLRLRIAGGDVMGDRRQRDELEALIVKTQVGGRAVLTHATDPDREFLPGLDIFVVSSRSEGFSLALLQAMQHGLPAVITSAGGCREVARPEIESLMYVSPDFVSLAGALERLLLSDLLAADLAEHARQRAEHEFSMAACAQRYVEFYDKSLSPARR